MQIVCAQCAKVLERWQYKFCSIKCQKDFQYFQFIQVWRSGDVDGGIGLTVRSVSRHIKRYLYEGSAGKCTLCGWNEVHRLTKVAPLEIDHIDGNSENNTLQNLRLLCPNCHSLTTNYKNLNKGKGRKWRMRKYLKNK
jgi:5-methylcytosine-specific restriction endonuclease McrA